MQKKQLPFSVLSTKKMRKVFVATLATVTVLSQILITYPAASAAAETGTDSQTRVAATEVGDFATLSKIISEDNGITNIVLTADITMTAGILIQAKKTELTIDGNGHRLTESSVNAGSNSATIYTNGASQLKTLNVKNLTIRGSHWYGTFTNNGNNVGVTHNYENIDYAGPQFIYNQYGYANFTGKNKIVISRPLNNLGTLAEMAEVTGVTISGEFIGEHTHTASYPFNMYNSTGGGRPYFTIKDNAKVDFTAGGSALISAPANTANFTVGKNATLNMNTLRHLFQNEMANITFDNNSTTTISRTDTTTRALMEVAQTFSINPNASLFIKQPAASGAHVIRTAAAGAVININDPRELDLNANGTGANRVFSAARSTTINFNKLAEIGVFNATNKTEVPDLAWQNANFSVVQASGQAGVVQVGATSNPANIQTTFVLANAKRITMTGTTVLAEKAVNGLFDSNDSATDVIKDTTTQATIDAAQTLVDAVTDPEAKIVIQKNLDRAQELLDARNEAIAEKARQELALKAVNELFTSDKPSTDAIKETTDQAAIDAAQKLVDAVTDPTAKAALQKDLDRAQELLDAINAEIAAEKARQEAALKAVNELFNSDKPSTDAIKETTTQDSIDAAQKLIDAITDPTIKAALQKDLDRAQELLDAREAELAAEKARQEAALKAVNELFNSDKPSTDAIKTTTDQAAIDAAQKLVDAITDPTIKAALQKDLDRAQELLDARNAELAAEKARQEAALKAVNELFNSDKPSTDAIKTTTDQAAIDAAQKLVDAITDPTIKAALQKDLDRAQELLDARNAELAAEKAAQDKARAAVNALFANNNPAGDIKTGLTQVEIDAAQALIDKVTDPIKKAELQADLDKAQAQLNANLVAPAAPQVNRVLAEDTKVIGKGQVGMTVVVKLADGTEKTGLVNANGDFSIVIPAQVADSKIVVTLKNAYGIASEATAVTVVGLPQPVINPVTISDVTVTGQIDVSGYAVSKVKLIVNGEPKTILTVGTDGTFSYYTGSLPVGTTIEVQYAGPNGSYLTESMYTGKVTVADAEATELVVNEMTIADGTVTGSATPNAKLRISIDGVAKAVVTADATGNYTYVTGTLASGTEVKVEVRNSFTGAYDTSKSVIVSGEIPGLLLTLNDLKAPAGDVSGEATAGHTVRISVNGVVKANVVASTDGKYAYNVGALTGGDVVKAEVRVGTQYLLATEKIVRAEFSLNAILDTDRTITGKAPAGKTVRISINGVPKSVTVADAAGNYTYLIGLMAIGDVIKIELRNTETGKYEDFVERTVIPEADAGQVTINALTDADTMVTGKTIPAGKLRISIDGKAKTVVNADASGNYSYFISSVKVGEVIKVELKENSVYSAFAETIVTAAPVAK